MDVVIIPGMMIDQKNPSSALRSRFDATVEINEPVCREHFRLRLRIDPKQTFPPTQPGQFIQLGCRPPMSGDEAYGLEDCNPMLGRDITWEEGQRPTLTQPELCGRLATLRKPFSFSGRGEDEKGTWVEIIHRVVGTGTSWLADRRVGDAVDLIGPLGNSFALPAGKKRGLLVGGGVGLPPMFYLAQALKAAGWDAIGFVGALTRDLLAVSFEPGAAPDTSGRPTASVTQFAQHGYNAVITTDDGSCGLKGRITAGLEMAMQSLTQAQRAETVVFVCGPEPMMHAVADLAAKYGIDCQVCMEQAMACGMGTCQSCIVKMEDAANPHGQTTDGRPWRYKLACTDGPVFPSTKVVW